MEEDQTEEAAPLISSVLSEEKDWQLKKSLSQSCSYMFDNAISTDVKFLVGLPEETAQAVFAHSFILIARSPVFTTMLLGEIPENKEEGIRISDVNHDAFRVMLRYMYTDETDLSPELVLPTLYCAKKYMLPALADACIYYLESNLEPANVCIIYEQSALYDEPALLAKCNSFIETRTEDILHAGGLSDVTQSTILKILRKERLSVSEIDLFTAVVAWATNECEKRGLENNGMNKREVLGDAIFQIHFPSLSLHHFANHVVPEGVLTSEEKCAIFEYLTCDRKSTPLEELPFPVQSRTKAEPSVLIRFHSYTRSNLYSGDCSIMKITCDQNILIKGFGVGSSNNYDSVSEIQVTIKQDRSLLCNRSVPIDDDRSGKIIRVLLHESIPLQPKVWYTVIITFHFFGDHDQGTCKRGKQGQKTMICDGVHFEFDRAEAAGFVPEILFCRV